MNDQNQQPSSYRVLSIDGGGVRGLIPVHILELIEQKIRAQTANPLAQISDYFDLFVGSSTGSIIVAALLCRGEDSRARYRPHTIRDLYMEESKLIFSTSLLRRFKYTRGFTSSRYSDKGLNQVLDKYFGETQLKDLMRPCLITAYDIETRRNFFFRQHRAVNNPHYNFLVKDAVHASSAAPVLFPIAEVRSQVNRVYHFIDGGVFAANPSLCAYAEVRHLYPHLYAKHIKLLSLGTGLGGEPIVYKKAKDWGAGNWMRPLHYITSEGSAESIDFQLRQLFMTSDRKHQYLRVNGEFDSNNIPSLDGCDKENLDIILDLAIEIGKSYDQKLNQFVAYLVNEGDD